MNREEIKNILPHREPMLLLDAAEVTPEGDALGKYTVRGDEFFLHGHFPGNPVVPGVILCEMLAQNCAVLLDGEGTGEPYYTGLNNVRFRRKVVPGDEITLRCRITRSKKPFYFAEGEARVGDELAVKADFSFALMGG